MEIKISGIKRNTSFIHDQDGACADIINMRYKDEEWQSFQHPQEKWLLRNTIQNANSAGIWFNHKATVDSKLIWWDNTSLYEVDAITDTKTLIKTIASVTKIYEYGVILLVVTSDNIYYFRYKDGTYNELKQLEHGRYNFSKTDAGDELTGSYTPTTDDVWIEDGLPKLTEIKRHAESLGKINGHVYFRIAFRTTDGNYILHSQIFYNFIGGSVHVPNINRHNDNGSLSYFYSIGNWGKPIFNYSFTQSQLDIINSYSGMIDKLCVFMAKPQSDWDFNATRGDAIYYNYDSGGSLIIDYMFLPHSTSIDKYIEDNNSYFLVSEIPLSELTITGTKTIEAGDLANLLTKTDLPVDDFTSHKYFSDVVYEYNSRLHYGDVSTRLGNVPNLTIFNLNSPLLLPTGYTSIQDAADPTLGFDVYALVKLDTENGIKTILTKYDYIAEFTDGTDKYACLNPVFMYPDQRAISFRIIAWDGSYTTISDEYTLKAHTYGNYAYYQFPFTESSDSYGAGTPSNVSTRFLQYHMLKLFAGVPEPLATDTGDIIETSAGEEINADTAVFTPDVDRIIEDSNRIQVSELNNLLYYPAKNSYRIGRLTNKIVGIASQAIPVSTGQFGQFPVYAFTSEGISVLEQGTSVLYQSIKPVSLAVCTNTDSITKIEGGILFSTDYGLFIISGSQITEISKIVEGVPEDFLSSITEYQNVITNKFPNTGDAISSKRFDDFLTNSIIAYDHTNKEIVIAGTNYSYIYSLLYNVWYKSIINYTHFFVNENNLYGINGTDIYNLADFDNDADVEMLTITRPVKFGTNGLKRISRAILRLIADIKTHTLRDLSFHVYGSLNGIEWKLLQGKNITDFTKKEIVLEFPRVTARYFIFVVGLKSKVVRIGGIEVEVEPVDNTKIR